MSWKMFHKDQTSKSIILNELLLDGNDDEFNNKHKNPHLLNFGDITSPMEGFKNKTFYFLL